MFYLALYLGRNLLIKWWQAGFKAETNSYSIAIAISENIPNTVANYQQIQNSINNCSEKILEYANVELVSNS